MRCRILDDVFWEHQYWLKVPSRTDPTRLRADSWRINPILKAEWTWGDHSGTAGHNTGSKGNVPIYYSLQPNSKSTIPLPVQSSVPYACALAIRILGWPDPHMTRRKRNGISNEHLSVTTPHDITRTLGSTMHYLNRPRKQSQSLS